ncbi:MAG: amidase [Chloroflexota bacterium]
MTIPFASITEVAQLLQKRQLSSVELTEMMLARIDALDPTLQSYATAMREQALAEAQQADSERAQGVNRGLLHGVPLAVKDLCFTKGVRTMGGTAVLADHIPTYDATVVRKLTEANAVLLGKLNLTEGAMGGYHPDFGVPRNPWNHAVWPGASSSGSGVAAAAGLAFGTLGSDTGGSIRIPAAANGVVGLKPTWGRVSRYGVLPLAESLDHVGPITRTVADAALMLQVIAGYDANDPTSLPISVPDILATIADGVAGVRIGLDEVYLQKHVEEELVTAVINSVHLLESLGATIVPVELPDFDQYIPAWVPLCTSEALAAHKTHYPSQREQYGPWFQRWLDLGVSFSAADYAEAHQLRLACNGRLRYVFQQIDVLAVPALTGPPRTMEPGEQRGSFDTFDTSRLKFTIPFDFNGAPTLNLPCGFSSDGLPLSLQFVGHPLSESLLCQVGYAFEQATDWHKRHPKV